MWRWAIDFSLGVESTGVQGLGCGKACMKDSNGFCTWFFVEAVVLAAEFAVGCVGFSRSYSSLRVRVTVLSPMCMLLHHACMPLWIDGWMDGWMRRWSL